MKRLTERSKTALTDSHPAGKISEKEKTTEQIKETMKVVAWWIPQFETPHRVWRTDPEKLFRGCRHPCRALLYPWEVWLWSWNVGCRCSHNECEEYGTFERSRWKTSTSRETNQIFVMYNREVPVRTGKYLSSPHFQDVFNLTMTYRLDSDIPIPHVKITDQPSWPQTKDIDIGNKTKLAIWI